LIFAIDGRELPELDITDYSIKTETLDGEGTGRSKAPGWPMMRDPQGQVINLTLEFATTNSQNADFVYLWQVIRSMGGREFAPVKFIDPAGGVIEQDMYCTASDMKYIQIARGNKVYVSSLKVNFIAKEGL